jgi:hypothetical protein
MAENSNGGIDFNAFHERQRARRKPAARSGGNKYTSRNTSTEKKEIPDFVMRMKYWKPDSVPTRIMFVPHGKEGLWYKYYARMVKTSLGWRNIVSNNWNGKRKVPCVLDYYAIEEGDDYIAKEQYAATIVVLEDFYKVPRKGKNDREYFVYERVPTPDRYGRVNHAPGYEDYEVVFGRQFHWTLSVAAHRRFMEKVMEIEDACWNCKEGVVEVTSFTCPECNSVLADKREEPLSRQDENLLMFEKIECPHCQAEIKATQVKVCSKQEGYGSSAKWVDGCGNAISKSVLTDPVELVVKSVPAGGNYSDTVIVDFDPAKEDRGLADWFSVPMDFDSFFGKQDLDDQCTALNKPYPQEFSQFMDENGNAKDARVLHDEFFSSRPDEEDDDSIPF